MRHNYFQYITNEHLQFKIKCHSQKGSSYWTLSGGTAKIEDAYAFTTEKVSPICQGYMKDGEYSIVPVMRGDLDLHWWMDMLMEAQPEDEDGWYAIALMVWDVCNGSKPEHAELVKVFDNILDEAMLSGVSKADGEFIIATVNSIWKSYRRCKCNG